MSSFCFYWSLLLTYDNVRRLPSELGHDPLEAGVLADLGRGVDVLHGEQGTKAEQQDLGQSSYQLKQGLVRAATS